MRRQYVAVAVALLLFGVVDVSGQGPLSAQIQRFYQGLSAGTTTLLTPAIGPSGYIGFGLTGNFTSAVPAAHDTILYRNGGAGVLAVRGTSRGELRLYTSLTDASTDYVRVRLNQNITGFSVLQTETRIANVNSVGDGVCLGTNNNTANKWCVGGATGQVGALLHGTTPNIIYAVSTPTISNSFGTGTADTIAGKASSFRVTVGTSPDTQGIYLFATTFTNIPICTANNETLANLVQAVPTTTQVTLNGTVTAGNTIGVHCEGY